MPQEILSVSRQKLSLLNKLINSAGSRIENIDYTRKIKDVKKSTEQVFKKIFSWEYNRSELEFE